MNAIEMFTTWSNALSFLMAAGPDIFVSKGASISLGCTFTFPGDGPSQCFEINWDAGGNTGKIYVRADDLEQAMESALQWFRPAIDAGVISGVQLANTDGYVFDAIQFDGDPSIKSMFQC